MNPRLGGQPARQWPDYLSAIGLVLLVTVACFVVRDSLKTIDVAMLYLLAVVFVASRYRRGPSLLASGVSIVLFDIVFVPPYGRLDVHDSAYVLTFAMMLLVAVVMSRLTARVREHAATAERREQRTASLYELTRELGGANTPSQVAAVASRHLGLAAAGEAAIALRTPATSGSATEVQRVAPPEDAGELEFPESPLFASARAREAAAWVYLRDLPAGAATEEFAELDALFLPLGSVLQRHGVAAVRGAGLGELGVSGRRTLELLARQAGLALERLALTREHERVRIAVEAERLRTTLLSSLSHDLRTPLASIEGAGTTLLDADAMLAPVERRELAEAIVEEARRMTRLVANLLDMVRVETGTLAVQKSWLPLEEVIGVARLRLDERLARHPVEVRLPPGLPLVPVDEVLMEQVVVNLLENAARHTPPGTPVSIGAWREGECVVVEVADRGPGVATGAEEAVFRKFYRAAPAGGAKIAGWTDQTASAGAGLGLAICRGVVTAHGGRIWLEHRRGGGASFRFTIPLDSPPPSLPPDQETQLEATSESV